MDGQPDRKEIPAEGEEAGLGYYVAINGDAYGPYAAEEVLRYLDEEKILRKDLAWRAGLSEWVSVETLLPEIQSAAPDLRSPPISTDAVTSKKPKAQR
jgi:hypothetical protein